ncbi:hypothetical protein HN51_066941 [Arachis hypogaea]
MKTSWHSLVRVHIREISFNSGPRIPSEDNPVKQSDIEIELTWGNVKEERVVRDRKAFLLHSQFVDTSIFMAIKAIQHVMESNIKTESNSPSSILHEERVGDLSVVVKCDIRNGNRV